MTNTKKFHKRSFHNDLYDFPELIKSEKSLEEYVKPNKYGNLSIEFSNPKAVIALNKALLSFFYGTKNWNIPNDYLCPPIPSRADYVHQIADLLAFSNKGKIPKGSYIKGLDVGVGANCIYPIVCNSVYGWSMLGSDIDEVSIQSAQNIVDINENLKDKIKLVYQKEKSSIFKGVINSNDKLHFTLCNPPFHKSLKDAVSANTRKVKNLSKNQKVKSSLNFGGKNNELWCDGGELKFISNMIKESKEFEKNCLWFTTLVSKKENLDSIQKSLKTIKAKEVKVIDMSHGQKVTRIVAWTFLSKKEQEEF